VLITDDEGCCLRCGRDCSDTKDEQYARARIDCQSETIADLLNAHDALAGHSMQSVLAQSLYEACAALVSAHDELAALRVASR
jgi:hypothetical protein